MSERSARVLAIDTTHELMFLSLRGMLLPGGDERPADAATARQEMDAFFGRPEAADGAPFGELALMQLRLILSLWRRADGPGALEALTVVAGVREEMAASRTPATAVCVLQELVERLTPDDPDGRAPQPRDRAARHWDELLQVPDGPSGLVRTLGDRLAELVPVLSTQDSEDEAVLAAEAVVLLRRPLTVQAREDVHELRALRDALLAYESAFEAAGCYGAASAARKDAGFVEPGRDLVPREACRGLWARARLLGLLDRPAEATGAYAGIVAAHRRQAAGEDREQSPFEIAGSQAQLAWAAVTAALALSPGEGAEARAAAEEAFGRLESVPYRKPLTALVRALYREALWRSDARSADGAERARAAGFLSGLHALIASDTTVPMGALGHALVLLLTRTTGSALLGTAGEESLAFERSLEHPFRHKLLLELAQAADSVADGQPPREQTLAIAEAVVGAHRWIAGIHGTYGFGYGGDGDDCLEELHGSDASTPYDDLSGFAHSLSRLASRLHDSPERRGEAVAPMTEAVALYRDLTGERWERAWLSEESSLHQLASGLNSLAFYLDQAHRPEEGLPHVREAVAIAESKGLLPDYARSHAIYRETLNDILEHLGPGPADGGPSR
ncbi:hypothetical protein [Streptomyces sp. NPDC002187]|uniref:hypothetical protein n=1 Tax=Streptomyces sp. NPDC002187 TaxID=3364637 RepID=UPI0036B9F248